MKTSAVILLTMGVLVCFSGEAQSNPKAEKSALEAANSWLNLVDGEKYGESWQEAASYFKRAVSREQWQQSMESGRKPLGKKLSRNLKSQQERTSLPGAPDGKYVVIQFQTSFEHKKSALETVTPMKDSDGKWRVSGYYIK